MFALTIKQPWAHHILNSGKNIENRTWKLPEHHRNTWIALHAAKLPDKQVTDFPDKELMEYGAIIGLIKFSECIKDAKSPWALPNHYHWIISEVEQIKPVKCRGNQGLWRVSIPLFTKQLTLL